MMCNLNHITELFRTCTGSVYKELYNYNPKIGLVRLIELGILLSLTFRHLSDYIFVNIVFQEREMAKD